MIAFKIDQSLTCDKVCFAVQSILNNIDTKDKLLIIEIKDITQDNNDLIPKLEYYE